MIVHSLNYPGVPLFTCQRLHAWSLSGPSSLSGEDTLSMGFSLTVDVHQTIYISQILSTNLLSGKRQKWQKFSIQWQKVSIQLQRRSSGKRSPPSSREARVSRLDFEGQKFADLGCSSIKNGRCSHESIKEQHEQSLAQF